MKKSNLTFAGGLLGIESSIAQSQGKKQMAFDWDECARIIKEYVKKHPNLKAEAGLQGDWEYTGGVIFENGKPTSEGYTYLSSNWARPTLILSVDGNEFLERVCEIESNERFSSGSTWDSESLCILGIEE